MIAAHEVTELLVRWGEGDRGALATLTPLVYAELRRLAARALSRERPDHTLQPTALVHEAFLRLHGGRPASCGDRLHFLSLAARLMRCILVDHARSRNAARRGHGALKLPLDGIAEPMASPVDLLDLDAALSELAAVDSRKARVIELRFFGGLSVEETAAVVGVSERTVKREWQISRAWLRREIARLGHGEPDAAR